MLNRYQYIEQIRRQVYGGQPSDEAEITVGLVNQMLEQAVGYAAQKNYTDAIKLDGIAYTNNSFYLTYKSIAVSKDENFLWKITLPHIPFGLGADEGISKCTLTDGTQISYPVVLLTENQMSFQKGRRAIPNKLIGYTEGKNLFILSSLMLSQYTAQVTLVSGGDSTDINSTLNVPADYIPFMTEYLVRQLTMERMMPRDVTPDGNDAVKFT